MTFSFKQLLKFPENVAKIEFFFIFAGIGFS